MSYRGSPNWESWAIHAWIDNVEHTYWHWKKRAEDTFEACEVHPAPSLHIEEQSREAQRKLAAELQYCFTEPDAIVNGRSALAEDVTEAELETVDWSHVADCILAGTNYDDIEYICEGQEVKVDD